MDARRFAAELFMIGKQNKKKIQFLFEICKELYQSLLNDASLIDPQTYLQICIEYGNLLKVMDKLGENKNNPYIKAISFMIKMKHLTKNPMYFENTFRWIKGNVDDKQTYLWLLKQLKELAIDDEDVRICEYETTPRLYQRVDLADATRTAKTTVHHIITITVM